MPSNFLFKNFCYILTISFFLSFFQINAQNLLLKNFKIQDGLPSMEVYCVFQDSKGFIWFGTDGGVSRFDGYSFKNYTSGDGLADNVVFEIKEDRHNRIWFRSLSGKLCYLHNDSIYKIAANELISKNIGNYVMSSFYIDSGDTLWCGLKIGCGYFKISPPYTEKNFNKISLKEGIYIIEIEKENFITCSVYEKGHPVWNSFFLYNKFRFKKQTAIPNLNATYVHAKKLAGDDYLIADDEKLFLTKKDNAVTLLDKQQTFNAETIFLKNTKNYTWLGLKKKGVLKFLVKENGLLQNNQQILNGYTVTDVMEDNEGGSWFTTIENGVYYSSPAHFLSYQDYNEFYTYTNYNMGMIGKDHVFISSKLDTVDVVSNDNILKNVNVLDKRFTEILEKTDTPSVFISTRDMVKQDRAEIYLWTKDEHHIQKMRDSLNKVSITFFYAYDKYIKKSYFFTRHWVFTYSKGDKYYRCALLLPSRVLSLYQDKNGVIWLGCLNGLWSFEKEKFIYHGNENEFFKNGIEDMKESAEGTFFYATRGDGLIIRKNGKYSKITAADGLSSNNCKCLLIDKDGTIWVGLKNGMCRLRNEKNNWQIFNFNFLGNEFNYEVFRIERIKNKLWLFTNKGLLSYETKASEAEISPCIYLNGFSVNEVSHFKNTTHTFSYNENFIKFSYTGLSFQSLGKISYRYKLDGLDTNWHTTQSTTLQYPFLPPGNYTFYVKAISFNGTESKQTATIHFVINKPFWKTVWFIVFCIIIMIIGLYLLFYFRLKEIKRKEAEKTLFNKQLAGLEMKALRSQMNPHFIFNAINSIQNYIVKKDSRTAQDYLAKFARLIRNVLENSKQESISLNSEIETLKLYIELEQLRVPNKFKFELIVKSDLQLDGIEIPPLILQPYVENAILHGLTPLEENKGCLTITLEKKANKLICIIDDNGIGRNKAAKLKQKKHLFHRSMGLSVTEDRIKAINKMHKTESSIIVEDKIGAEGKAEGTRVIITINLDN
ncbi:MAG TPA: histidine kinase [Bacteroidia bacterium]|nr:histidine kinase [Bacteroidia bacterium]